MVFIGEGERGPIQYPIRRVERKRGNPSPKRGLIYRATGVSPVVWKTRTGARCPCTHFSFTRRTAVSLPRLVSNTNSVRFWSASITASASTASP